MSKNVVLNNVKNTLTSNKTNKFCANEEYLQNQKQIDCISKVLVEHADVPQKLIDWLIEAVRNNTIIECKK